MKTTNFGERRIRITEKDAGFVGNLKKDFATLMDDLEFMRSLLVKDNQENWSAETKAEFHRLMSLAQTNLEQASMWATKALTTVE